MDIKQRLLQTRDWPGPSDQAPEDKRQLASDALAEIERLEKLNTKHDTDRASLAKLMMEYFSRAADSHELVINGLRGLLELPPR
jgi:hypothetical protein